MATTRSIAFLITNRYQLHHYAPIAAELDDVTFVIEHRDQDFGVDAESIERHVAHARIEHVRYRELALLDGRFEVIVCQTPVLLHRLLERSVVVAQQYSLAKESYQYGTWRALAGLNLMYGPYSVAQVEGFAAAVAVGNPTFDGLDMYNLSTPSPVSKPRGLYVPTYGSLSSADWVLDRLGDIDGPITVKAHHMDQHRAVEAELPSNCTVVGPEVSPAALYAAHDFVISDHSGAAFDAVAMRRPLVLAESGSSDRDGSGRLGAGELGRPLLDGMFSSWRHGDDVNSAIADAFDRLPDDGMHAAFVERFISHPGISGSACAAALVDLLDHGPPEHPARDRVAARDRELLGRTLELAGDVRRLERSLQRSQTRPARVAGRARARVTTALRRALARHRRLEIGIVEARRKLRVRLAARRGSGPTTRVVSSSPSRASTAPVDVRREVALAVMSHLGEVARVAPAQGRLTIGLEDDQRLPLAAALRSTRSHGCELSVALRLGTGFVELDSLDALDDSLLRRATSIRVASQPDTPINERLEIALVGSVGTKREHRALDRNAGHYDWSAEFSQPQVTGLPEDRGATLWPGHRVDAVDAVLTWVDGSDPQWRRRRDAARTNDAPTLVSAAVDERFQDRGELRFALRSIWRHAPFVRHIYLVTAGQRPTWLADNERLTLVDHRDIFPDPAALPTFNSHAIEACLHRIAGLSEHFVYFNDDVFLGRETTVADFFTVGGLPRVRFSADQRIARREPAVQAIPTDWAAANANSIVFERTGLRFDRKVAHVPHALRRTMLSQLDADYGARFDATRSATFRSSSDLAVPSMLAPFWALASGEAVEASHDGVTYLDTGRREHVPIYAEIDRVRPMFFCLNSTRFDEVPRDEQVDSITSLLTRIFPNRSPFER